MTYHDISLPLIYNYYISIDDDNVDDVRHFITEVAAIPNTSLLIDRQTDIHYNS